MQHSRNADILRVNELAGELFRQVDARDRFPNNFVILGILSGNFGRHLHVPADAGRDDFDVEALAAQKISVGNLFGGRTDNADHPVRNGKLVHRCIEARGSQFQQFLASGGRCLA